MHVKLLVIEVLRVFNKKRGRFDDTYCILILPIRMISHNRMGIKSHNNNLNMKYVELVDHYSSMPLRIQDKGLEILNRRCKRYINR